MNHFGFFIIETNDLVLEIHWIQFFINSYNYVYNSLYIPDLYLFSHNSFEIKNVIIYNIEVNTIDQLSVFWKSKYTNTVI